MKSLLFQIFSNPPPSLSPPTPTTTAVSVVLFLGLNGWSHHILSDIMDLHMSSLVTLVPEGPLCVFYALRHQVYWGLTHNVFFCWYSDLISHAQRHTAHSGVSWMTHTYKYIFTYIFMCSQQLYLLPWMNNSMILKIYFPQCFFFSKIIHL